MKETRLKVHLNPLFNVSALISAYYSELNNTPSLSPHKLNCWQFYYQSRHKMDIKIEDTVHTLEEGDAIFVPPHAIRQVRNAYGRNDCMLFSFDCTSPAMQFFCRTPFSLTDEERDLVTRIVFLALNCTVRTQGPAVHGFSPKKDVPTEMLSFLKVYLELFLSLLYNRLHGNLKGINYIDSTHETRDSLIVSRMKDYLSEHIHENITIEMLAKEFFLSATHAKRIFKQVTDRSIMSYFTELKIKEAKSLIKNSDLSLREISELLAYSSPAHFSDVFRRHTAQTPSEYRQKHVVAKPQSIRTLD